MPSGLHFNITGSNIVEKCQQVSRSQSLLQHTWPALQLSEISVFTGAGKKRFLSFERKARVPEQRSFKILLVLLASSGTRGPAKAAACAHSPCSARARPRWEMGSVQLIPYTSSYLGRTTPLDARVTRLLAELTKPQGVSAVLL